ncbi:hypothetical protein IWX76_000101 [Pedobacter sp. CAN_A7]
MINERYECEILRKEFMESFKIGSSPGSWKISPDVNEVKHLLMTFKKFHPFAAESPKLYTAVVIIS